MIIFCLEFIFVGLTIYYLFSIFRFGFALRILSKQPKISQIPSISIIVSARNEELTIADCLESLLGQDYPSDQYEIIVVNDQSTDQTRIIVEQYQHQDSRIQLLNVPSEIRSSKKHALEQGVQKSKHEIIFITDADCRVGPAWLRKMSPYFKEDIGLVSGLTILDHCSAPNLFTGLQVLDFIGLAGIGAALIGRGTPLFCNASNLAYRKKIFYEVHGFEGINDIKTGDDDLFLQKVVAQTKWKIAFSTDTDTIIHSKPALSIKHFFSQRSRWASKSTRFGYKKHAFFLVSFYVYFLLLTLIPFLGWSNPFLMIVWAGSFFLKIVADWIFIKKFINIFRLQHWLKYFIPTDFFQIIYTLITAFSGFFFDVRWKERRIKS